MKAFHAIFDRFDAFITVILEWVCITLFAGLTLLLTANIVMRFVPLFSLHWFDEIVELIFAALVFYGAAALWVTRGHFSVGDWISKYIPSVRLRYVYRLLIELASLFFMGVFLKYSYELAMRAEDVTNALQLPKTLLYSCMPIAAAIMLLYSVKNVVIEVGCIIDPENGERFRATPEDAAH
ncbi:TRAP transporter small permease subunit [Uliginosibacterium sp. 31-16]|uniref:TRAP transporter small permease n=1 Tax=Uliginosibacterium sp. 31-16 TaxID=3068315 RepID=UPI00273ED8A9|nr:TRAP transporter small permease subunit [Uliginosibacterium sp. 31-16]MDP5241337.1 TRAP transporter small permease subunit [Uliginosibacterium sp. 31-16]